MKREAVFVLLSFPDQLVNGIQARGVQQLYSEITSYSQQQYQFEQQMQQIYTRLCQVDRRLPQPQKGIVTLRLLSRLVAEIGPPDDFRTTAQLMRYAGLNLCERQSGKWRGRTTISRRGSCSPSISLSAS